MHRLFSARFALILALLLLLALPMTALAQDFEPEYDDADYPITVTVGEEFLISMEANPSTGYQWELTQQVDESILQLVDFDHQRSPHGAIGSPGFSQFTFLAVAEGSTQLTFQYVRPWEDDVEPARAVTFTIEVLPAEYLPATPILPADEAPADDSMPPADEQTAPADEPTPLPEEAVDPEQAGEPEQPTDPEQSDEPEQPTEPEQTVEPTE